MTAQAQATVDSSALRANLKRVRELAPTCKVLAVIKENGYGHGVVRVAKALAEADALGLVRMTEAIAVRDAGCRNPIVLLEGIMSTAELDDVHRYKLDLVVHQPGQLATLGEYSGQGTFNVWLKIDTGMNRLGFRPEDAFDAWRKLDEIPCVPAPPRLMTHLACADEVDNDATDQQVQLFDQLTADWPGERTVANSAGILRWPRSHADWVRPGLMLYGVSPLPNVSASSLGLTPAMTLRSQLVSVNQIAAGDRVGYGGVWQAEKDTCVGIVAVGYGDGYPWRLKSGTPVLIRGRRYPLVGRVSMCMIAVDLGADSDVRIGEEAILWGPGLPVEELADRAGTIAYELLCGIS